MWRVISKLFFIARLLLNSSSFFSISISFSPLCLFSKPVQVSISGSNYINAILPCWNLTPTSSRKSNMCIWTKNRFFLSNFMKAVEARMLKSTFFTTKSSERKSIKTNSVINYWSKKNSTVWDHQWFFSQLFLYGL